MRQRTVAEHAIHRAARALTGHEQTGNQVASIVPDADRDTFRADPRAWITGDITLHFRCTTATETEITEQHGPHTLSLTAAGPVMHDHPHLGETDLEAFLVALGGPAPTCLLLAAAATSDGAVLPGHNGRFFGAARTPLLTVRYLTAARAWLAHYPGTDLPALHDILRAGLSPAGWQHWADLGFTPATAKGFLRRGIPLDTAAQWLSANLVTTAGAALAARGVPVTAVTDLIAAGLNRTAAFTWAETGQVSLSGATVREALTAEQMLALGTAGFHPTEAVDAVHRVGFETALAYGAAGLATGRKVRGNNTWWLNFEQHVEAATAWATRTPLHASNAGWLCDLRNADLADEDQDLSPEWAIDWMEHGVTTMEELAELAPLSYHPCELDGSPRPVDPDGHPIRWSEAIWLWRATGEKPEEWIAASAGVPDWNGNGEFHPTCWACTYTAIQPQDCAHDVPDPHLTPVTCAGVALPEIADDRHHLDLYHCRSRQTLVEAMAEAADEGFPASALPALAAHGPVTAAVWEYATALVSLLEDDEYVPFLTSHWARPDLYRIATGAEPADHHVRDWRAATASLAA